MPQQIIVDANNVIRVVEVGPVGPVGPPGSEGLPGPGNQDTATGIKNGTTFLRGDNTWAVPSGGIATMTVPGKVISLAIDFSGYQPKADVLLTGSFTPTGASAEVELEISAAMGDAIAHAVVMAYWSQTVAPPLHNGAVSSAIAGVTKEMVGKLSGMFNVGATINKRLHMSGLTPGVPVNVELRYAIVGYYNTIQIGNLPQALVVLKDNSKCYVVNSMGVIPIIVGRNIDNYKDVALPIIPVSHPPGATHLPAGAAGSPDSMRVYVCDWYGGGIAVIDTDSDAIIGWITTGAFTPFNVRVSLDGTKLYVSDTSGSVRVFSTVAPYALLSTTPVTGVPFMLGLTPDGTKLVVATSQTGGLWKIAVIRTSDMVILADGVDTGATDVGVFKSGFTPDNASVWVPLTSMNSVRRFDLATNTFANTTETIIPFGLPLSCALTQDGKTIFYSGKAATGRTWAYATLPAVAGQAPKEFDGLRPDSHVAEVALSSDAYIFVTQRTAGNWAHWQGGTLNCRASGGSPFWGEHCRMSIYGGS